MLCMATTLTHCMDSPAVSPWHTPAVTLQLYSGLHTQNHRETGIVGPTESSAEWHHLLPSPDRGTLKALDRRAVSTSYYKVLGGFPYYNVQVEHTPAAAR